MFAGNVKLKRRATIFDLEKFAGVSRATISRAFNDSSEVSSKTREMILHKAAQIGYTPHPAARTMKLGASRRIGLLLPHLQNPYHGDLMESLDQYARQRKSVLLVGMSHHDTEIETELLKHWASGETDSIIVGCLIRKIDPHLLRRIQAGNFQAVFLYAPPSPLCDSVGIGNWEALDRAMKLLLTKGHRRIAYLGQEDLAIYDTGPYLAYVRGLMSASIPIDKKLIYFGPYDRCIGLDAWQEWKKLRNPPTAALCFNDVHACGLIKALKLDGLSIPADFSVIGVDDIAEAGRTGLTTVRTDPADMAEAVFDLLDVPRKDGEPGRTRQVPGDLVIRDTVASPRTKRKLG